MLSLYIHIPFCNHKCKYCSFFVMPESEVKEEGWESKLETMKQTYFDSLKNENQDRAQKLDWKQIRTIYIGGGTPFQLWAERLFDLIDDLLETRDCEFLEELSIELNPDPFDEVLDFVKEAQRKYKDIFRLRFSFGIQSFDDKILQSSGRNYHYNHLVHRFRELAEIKTQNACYNLDFIAFGSRWAEVDSDWLPWDHVRRDFFDKLVKSHIFDGFSVYTLELFPGAERYYKTKERTQEWAILSDDETIWKEFQYIKKVVMDAGYGRYEISNFALSGKRSLHNMVYWTWDEYLGLGINASGMLYSLPSPLYEKDGGHQDWKESVAYRYKNTQQRKKYLWWEWLDQESIMPLNEKAWKLEQVMLLLRTDLGIQIEQYRDVLVEGIDEVIIDLVASKHLVYNPDVWRVKLRSKWLDVYNSVLMEMLEEL